MSKVNVYIIHGFMATPNDHWFQWLKSELEGRGVDVEVLSLPDSSSPNPFAWQESMRDNINYLGENTYIVTHSLGTVSLLNHLVGRLDEDSTIGGLVVVSGFVSSLSTLPELDSFVSSPVDFEKIIQRVPKRVVIGSPQDSIVPYALTEALAKKLETDIYPIDNAGHFLASDGFERFPKLLEILLNIMK